jgi:hypothetical protein
VADDDYKPEKKASKGLGREDMVQELLHRARALQTARNVFNAHWDEIRMFIRPLAQKATGGTGAQDVAGTKNRQAILDSSGESASDVLVSAVFGRLMNPGTRWFSLAVQGGNRDRDSALWLEHAAEEMRMHFERPGARFPVVADAVLGEVTDFGTGCLYIAENMGRPVYQARPLAECFLAENADGAVDTVYRNPSMTARQIAASWPDTVPDVVRKCISDGDMDKGFGIWHCVWPADELEPSERPRVINGKAPWASAFILEDPAVMLEWRGYSEFPYVTPRWATRAGEVYGRGPGVKALADVKMLQRAMKAQISGAEKALNPSLLVADDGVLGPVKLVNGGLTYVRGEFMQGAGSPVRPLDSGVRLDLGESFMAGVRSRIADAYYRNLLSLPREPRMPATHILALEEERNTVLAPFTNRLQLEFLGPLIDRTFGVMFRNGWFGEPPPQLRGQDVRVEYESAAAKGQRIADVRAIAQYNELMGPIMQVDPSVKDNVDFDAMARVIADRLAMPAEIRRDPKAVGAMRQQRAQAEAQAQQMQQAQQMAEIAATGGEAAQNMAGAAKAAGIVPGEGAPAGNVVPFPQRAA